MSWKCKHCGNIDLYEIGLFSDDEVEIGTFNKDGEPLLDNGKYIQDYFDVICGNCLALGSTIEDIAEWVEE